MATNLRLRPEIEQALRAEATKTGRSQQDIIRIAIEEHLGLVPRRAQTLDELIAAGVVTPPTPYRRALPFDAGPGPSSLELLQREDRF